MCNVVSYTIIITIHYRHFPILWYFEPMESLPIMIKRVACGFIVTGDNTGDIVWPFLFKFNCAMRQPGLGVGI